MNQKQLQKLAGSGYISLFRVGKKIESITVKKTRGLTTYRADPEPVPNPRIEPKTKKINRDLPGRKEGN